MSLSFVFIWFFKLGLWGLQLVDRKAKNGPLRAEGTAGGEVGKVPARKLLWKLGLWRRADVGSGRV